MSSDDEFYDAKSVNSFDEELWDVARAAVPAGTETTALLQHASLYVCVCTDVVRSPSSSSSPPSTTNHCVFKLATCC